MNNKDWPIYFKENLILGNPKSEVGIVTLFTSTKKIVEKIDKNLFCLSGQLYSKEGINFILRNILANPSIRYLIVCGTEISGSGKALIDFFEKGIDKDYKILGYEFALIHKEIPKEALELVRKNVQIKNLIGIDNPQEIIKTIKSCPFIGKPFSESQIFPDHKEQEISIFPTDESIFKINEKYIGTAWLRILKLILRYGSINDTWYGNKARELFNIAAVISNENPFDPKMFPWLQITEKDIEKYNLYIMNPEKGDELYSYGERLWDYEGQNHDHWLFFSWSRKGSGRGSCCGDFFVHLRSPLWRTPLP